MRFGYAYNAHRYESPATTEENSNANQEYKRVLFFNSTSSPGTYDTAAKINAGQKPMNVIQPRRGIRLSQIHLYSATEKCYGREKEKANLRNALAGKHGLRLDVTHHNSV